MKVVGLMTLSLVSMVAAQCPKDKWFKGGLGDSKDGLFFQEAEMAKDAKFEEAKHKVTFCTATTFTAVADGQGACKVNKLYAVDNASTDAPIAIGLSGTAKFKELTEIGTDEILIGEAKKFTCAGDAAGKNKGHVSLKVIPGIVKNIPIKFKKEWLGECKISADGKKEAADATDACAVADVDLTFQDTDKTFGLGDLKGCAYGKADTGGKGFCSFPCGCGWIIVWVVVPLVVVGAVVAVVLLSGGEDDEDDDDDEDEDDKDDDE